MNRGDSERDYLVATQPESNPASFVEAIKEAFLLEHDCVQSQEIAEVLGVDKSRISQIFANPKALKPESIESLLARLSSRAHKKRIVQAWIRECFGAQIEDANRGQLTGSTITERTIRRVDRQLRESRVRQASQTAKEAAEKTDDPVLRERLLDRAFFAHQRLDEVGQAMKIARSISDSATFRGEIARVGAGYLMRIRLLRGISDSTPNEILPILDEVERMLPDCLLTANSNSPYILANPASYRAERTAVLISFAERGQMTVDEDSFRAIRAVAIELATKTKSFQQRSRQLQIASRISLILGETFQATEYLERSFDSGSIKNLNAYEVAGVLQARLLARTRPPQEVSNYLQEVISGCYRSTDLYHARIAEVHLARVESDLFNARSTM